MSEQIGENPAAGEKPWFPVVDGDIPEDVVELVLTLQSMHDARSIGDHEHAEAIKKFMEDNPDKFPPDLIEEMDAVRKSGIRARRTDQAQ